MELNFDISEAYDRFFFKFKTNMLLLTFIYSTLKIKELLSILKYVTRLRIMFQQTFSTSSSLSIESFLKVPTYKFGMDNFYEIYL